MRPTEARWIKRVLSLIPAEDISPVLELGSSTVRFRTTVKPHIEEDVHAPLRIRGIRVVTTDLKSDAGIEISGDVYDDAVKSRIRSIAPRCILCCNMFEHVTDRYELARVCDELLSPRGYLVVSVPRSYPYHADPIDNRFRPTPREIAKMFPRYRTIDSQIVQDSTYWEDLVKEHGYRGLPVFLLGSLAKILSGYGGMAKWKQRVHRYWWLFSPYTESVIVLQKP